MSPFFGESPKGPGSSPSSEKRDVSNPLPEETFAHGLSLAGASGCGGALAAGTSHDIEVAAEGRTGGDLQANRFGIHTLREVKEMIRTLKKLMRLAPASVNIERGRADRRNSMETARCETTHVIIFRVLQCCSGHTPAFESLQ